MALTPQTLIAMNRRLIAIYEKTPLIHVGKMTDSQVRREKERFLTEQRIERLKQQLNLKAKDDKTT